MLTAERAHELLDYDPITGALTWRVDRNSNARAGDEAGCINLTTGYRYIKNYKAHRIAFLLMKGRWPHDQMDHINGVRDDNRWANLREVGHLGNQRNRRLSSNNTSGSMGVYWYKRYKKWRAIICLNGRKKHLGYFDDLAEAIAARKVAEREYGFHPNHGRAA